MVGEMRKVRCVMERGEYWEIDMSTPLTLHGIARPIITSNGSRGSTLSRHNQVDFFQRFMSLPFVPSYHKLRGFCLQRLVNLSPSPSHSNWFTTLLGEFNIQKFVSFIRTNDSAPRAPDSSWLKTIGTKLSDKSLYALNLCSELLLTPDDTLVLSVEHNGSNKDTYRKKALLHHKFLNHNLTVEAASPELFVDHLGNYWDVPFSMAVDLSSVASNGDAVYHFSINHNQGTPKRHDGQVSSEEPPPVRPGLCAKGVYAIKRSIDIWRSRGPMLKLVQPYDIFLSTPHISASGIVGAILTACQRNNTVASQVENSEVFNGFTVHAPGVNSTVSADTFASLMFSAQHGNFQRLVLDLTRVHARLDFPSGSKLLSGAALVAQDLYDSNQPTIDVLQAICPKVTVSLQQQIAGPFSFRVDSGVSLDLKNYREGGSPKIHVNDPVFAVEYALQVLGSAKAVAWYSPNQQEFMLELRFFET